MQDVTSDRFLCVDASPPAVGACRETGHTVTVSSGFEPADVTSVRFGDCAALAMAYLASLGHTRIGFIGPQGFLDQASIGAPPGTPSFEPLPVRECTAAAGAAAMTSAVGSGGGCTAIFCSSDSLAAGAINACLRHGVDVPEQISILGCGDFAAEVTLPALSSLRWDTAPAGDVAVQRLLGMTVVPTTLGSYSAPKVIVRKSTGINRCFT
jgi:LacI family transcriptional regulator